MLSPPKTCHRRQLRSKDLNWTDDSWDNAGEAHRKAVALIFRNALDWATVVVNHPRLPVSRTRIGEVANFWLDPHDPPAVIRRFHGHPHRERDSAPSYALCSRRGWDDAVWMVAQRPPLTAQRGEHRVGAGEEVDLQTRISDGSQRLAHERSPETFRQQLADRVETLSILDVDTGPDQDR